MIKFVSSNEYKFEEIREMMKIRGIDIEWVKLKYEEIQSDSTEEISRDSCSKLKEKIHGKFFIEDTGIFIKALSGFPGPYSSYIQKTIGNKGIIDLMVNLPREATFVTVISYWNGTNILQFKGETDGIVADAISQGRAFGYDPIFIPKGKDMTMSLLSLEEKNKVSQRGKAMNDFIQYLLLEQKGTSKEI
ncbi:MAG: RdgB/HAM1 family non-canonical purine NTP pyrophosphatase [Thermoplasmataceae archaeon]